MSMHDSWVNQGVISVLGLRENIENQLLNAHKKYCGQPFNLPIRLETSDGDRFVNSIKSASWAGSRLLVLEAVVLRTADQHIGGEFARIELDLRNRFGELAVIRNIR